MMQEDIHTLLVTTEFNPSALSKNSWVIILHASRMPPHIGILINGHYSSLTIKGHELNVKAEALLKLISQKKTETLAIQLIKQPVFSLDHQKEVFEHFIKQFTKVEANGATCLSPVKLFLQEFYALPYLKHEMLFELTNRLTQNAYIYQTVGFNVDDKLKHGHFSLPQYTHSQLQQTIEQETTPQIS